MKLKLTIAAIVCLAIPEIGRSADLVRFVDCDAGDTITGTLDALIAVQTHDLYLNISGTCSETVQIRGLEKVYLIGNPAATILDPQAGFFVGRGILNIFDSRNIFVIGLTLRGAGPPDGLNGAHVVDSKVVFDECIFEGGGVASGGGLWVQGHSNVKVLSSKIQDNEPQGIRIDNASFVQIDEPAFTRTATVIQRNTFGVALDSNAELLLLGSATIRDNVFGVYANGGEVFLCCGVGRRELLSNSIGINLRNGAGLNVIGPVLIEDNLGFGINMSGSTALFQVGGHAIRNNGSTGNPVSGGIYATGSHIDFAAHTSATQISGNGGFGVTLHGNSSAVLDNTDFSNNGGCGLSLDALSTGLLDATAIMQGNGIFDLCCSNSVVSGDTSGVQRISCPALGPTDGDDDDDNDDNDD